MKSLTIAYITSREEPRLEWFFNSLVAQLGKEERIEIIIVDSLRDRRAKDDLGETASKWSGSTIRHVIPKPTIWQGEHRITKQDWWAAANARNTAICLCETDWIAFLDDRSVLLPGWLDCVRQAMHFGYAVCGSYEKVHDLIVESGLVKSYVEPSDKDGNKTGKDSRTAPYKISLGQTGHEGAVMCPGEWFFGCSFMLPMQWALAVNGQDETCDGISMEDSIFGLMLKNNGYPTCYDPRMKIIEDRTPGKLGTVMRREDKGVSPNDKSHAMLAMLRDCKRATHPWDLKAIRETVLAGGQFPTPEKKVYRDWFDGEIIDEHYMDRK